MRPAIIVLLGTVACGAFAQSTSAVRLESGIAKEDADGDLKSAIDIYQRIASDSTAPRDVRAKALLHLAGCYEKLGRKARQVYEQIVRDYADQPVATEARNRLASLKQQEHPAVPTTMMARKIEWSQFGLIGESDTDGQRAVFQDSQGQLFLGDLAAHSKRMFFKPKPGDASGWVPSRDFSIVYIHSNRKPNRPPILAVVKTDGTGYRELIRDSDGTVLGDMSSAAWSWDNRFLLVWSFRYKHGAHLFLVSVADGKRRELASSDTGYFNKAVFSPDGRYVAYEVAPLPDHAETSRVFVMPVQGGQPREVYESAPKPAQNVLGLEIWTLLDWTADGRYLALADAPKGKTGLYLLPTQTGSAIGAPVLVRYGNFESAFTTASGALVYRAGGTRGRVDLFLASLDANWHLGTWQRLEVRAGHLNDPLASFTPDNGHILYMAQDDDPAGGASLILHDVSTGDERVLYRSGRYLFCQSARHEPLAFCTEDKGGGKTDLVSVSLESGEVRLINTFQNPKGVVTFNAQSTGDDKALYLMKADLTEDNGPMVQWDLTTRHEIVLEQPSEVDRFPWPVPSADDRFVISSNNEALYVRAVSGGDWKSLVRGNWWPFLSTPDGKWVLYKSKDSVGKSALFRIPIEGGEPQQIGELPALGYSERLCISSDGHQLLAWGFDYNRRDLWVLDNFVPSVAKASNGGAQ